MSLPNVCTVGSSKTGTSGLHYSVLAAMPGEPVGLYEQHDPKMLRNLERYASDRPLVAKFLFTNRHFTPDLVEPFHKRLLIVRDPRDTLVSVMLFYAGVLAASKGRCTLEEIEEVADLVERKEQDPGSVDFLTLYHHAHRVLGNTVGANRVTMGRFDRPLRFADDAEAKTVYYERFVADDLDDVSDYLGLELANTRPPAKVDSLVVRSATSAEWRRWFTASDVAELRPKLAPYMARFGYEDDWELSDEPIDPEFGSEYVRRSARKRFGQSQAVRSGEDTQERLETLRAAAAKGDPKAALDAATTLVARHGGDCHEEIRTLYRFAAMSGRVRAMRDYTEWLRKHDQTYQDLREARRWELEVRERDRLAHARKRARREAEQRERVEAASGTRSPVPRTVPQRARALLRLGRGRIRALLRLARDRIRSRSPVDDVDVAEVVPEQRQV